MITLYVTDDWTFNLSTLTIDFTQSERQVTLDPKQAKILSYLMKHGQTLVSRDKLYFEIYGNDPAKSDSTINPYISKLRRILSPHTDNKETYIKTIPKGGYQFVAPFTIEQLEIVEPTTIIRQVRETATHYKPLSSYKLLQQRRHQNIIFTFLALLTLVLAIAFFVIDPFNSLHQPMLKNSQVLIHDNGSEGDFDVSPNQQYLVYVNEQKNQSNNIRIKDITTGKINNLYTSPRGKIYSPVISPDFSNLIFATTESGICYIKQITLIKQDDNYIAGKVEQLVPCSKFNAWTKLEYIRDNQVIFHYYEDYSKPATIKLLDLKSKQSHVLISPPLNTQGDIAFSYNAKLHKIAIIRGLDNANRSLFLYDIDSTELKLLTTLPYLAFHIAWFSDSQLIFLKNEQVTLFDIKTKQQQIISSPIVNLQNIVVRNKRIYAKKGLWNHWDIYRFDINTLQFSAEIDSEYSEYLPQSVAKKQMYYAAKKSGSVQIWYKNKTQHKQITHFDDQRQIDSFIVADNSLVVLNTKSITFLDLEGKVQTQLNNRFNLYRILHKTNNLLYGEQHDLSGNYLVELDIETEKLTKIKQVYSAHYYNSAKSNADNNSSEESNVDGSDSKGSNNQDDRYYYVTPDKSQLVTLDQNADKTRSVFNIPKKFQNGYVLRIINNKVIFASIDDWNVLDLATNQIKTTSEFKYPTGYLHCKNVENTCFFVAFLPGNTEIIRLE